MNKWDKFDVIINLLKLVVAILALVLTNELFPDLPTTLAQFFQSPRLSLSDLLNVIVQVIAFVVLMFACGNLIHLSILEYLCWETGNPQHENAHSEGLKLWYDKLTFALAAYFLVAIVVYLLRFRDFEPNILRILQIWLSVVTIELPLLLLIYVLILKSRRKRCYE